MKFTKKDFLLIFISIVLVVLQVWLELKLPEYLSEITTLIQTPNTPTSDILDVGKNMLICSAFSMACSLISVYCSAIFAASIGQRLHQTVFNKVMSFNNEEIDRFSISSLLTRTILDVDGVKQLLIMGIQVVIRAPIMFILAISKIMDKAWQWSAVTAGSVVAFLLVAGVAILIVAPRFKIIEELVDKISRLTRENLNGIRVVRAYNAEQHQEKKFEETNNELLKHSLFTDRVLVVMGPILGGILSSISLVVYWTGAFIISEAAGPDKLTIFSDMIVYSTYAMEVIMSFMLIGGTLMALPSSMVHIKRIKEVMKTNSSIISGETYLEQPIEKITFKDVCFKYPEAEEPVLKNISFEINKGETLAIIGSTGCGKSSLANLFLRLYDPTEGQVFINDTDIKSFDLSSLRDKFGYVSQKPILFSGNIAKNVMYGQSEDTEKLYEALKCAQAWNFVSEIPEKEQANVAQNGSNYSGGQKQRLSIARAIYKNPEVLIFDDSFSALDYKTDSKLRSELDENMKGITKIIVAQRIGTIKNATKILVLDRGQIVGLGTHQELLKDCAIYKEIALSQLSEEELV